MRNILSLFDGISVGQLVLNNLSINYDKYYASEIDNNCIKVTQSHYKDTTQLGDINNWKSWSINWREIDLVLFGFPCTNFSILGNKLGFRGQTGKLFFIARDILNYCKSLNPNVKFFAENVPMKEEYKLLIDKELGVEGILIDSVNYSVQIRKRIYWFNFEFIPIEEINIQVLNDILDTNGDFEYYNVPFNLDSEDKIICGRLELNGHDFIKRVNSRFHKLQTLTGISGGSQEKKVLDSTGRVRKLTVSEYCKAMGLSSNYCNNIPKGRARDLIGNSWEFNTVFNLMRGLK